MEEILLPEMDKAQDTNTMKQIPLAVTSEILSLSDKLSWDRSGTDSPLPKGRNR